jgi:hypothetical protein
MYSWSTPQFSRSHTAKKSVVFSIILQGDQQISLKYLKIRLLLSRGGQTNFFLSRHIANPPILGLLPQPQIRKFF